jgi:hypothetical protein
MNEIKLTEWNKGKKREQERRRRRRKKSVPLPPKRKKKKRMRDKKKYKRVMRSIAYGIGCRHSHRDILQRRQFAAILFRIGN